MYLFKHLISKIEDYNSLLQDDEFFSFLQICFKKTLANDKKNNPALFKLNILSLQNYISCIESIANKTVESRIISQEDKRVLCRFTDSFYKNWTNEEKFLLLKHKTASRLVLTNYSSGVSNIINDLYLRIICLLSEKNFSVERNYYGFVSSVILTKPFTYYLPEGYEEFRKIDYLNYLVITPPFITNSKMNTRKGTFIEHKEKITIKNLNGEFVCLALNINGIIGYCYINLEYLPFIAGIGNLFKILTPAEMEKVELRFILFFGVDTDFEVPFYYKDNDIYVGVCNQKGGIDYFGYVKKMILTLFNLIMIEQDLLPIHGAGLRITMKNGQSYVVVILGDSGAGKSETIEALRKICGEYVNGIDILFDDMGTFHLLDGQVYTTGTETGAFVRLDDLDRNYAFSNISTAVYMNINRPNSRVVIPVTTFDITKTLNKVDFFLLANNFTKTSIGMEPFADEKTAISDFILGARLAKSTTDEIGLVHTFFANPFGPVQCEQKVRTLIDKYFDSLYANHVYVGTLYTQLGIDAVEGPKQSSRFLLEKLVNYRK